MIKNIILILPLVSLLMLGSCGEVEQADSPTAVQEGKATTETPEKTQTAEETKTILFFGNSLTAGYGLEPDQAFPALIQQRIDSLGLPYTVINAGVSGETTAGGRGRIDWLLKQQVDVFVLELGANDGLRGIKTEETYSNLKAIIDKVRQKNPEVQIVLAGMQIPPSMGQKYTQQFREVYTRLAEEEQVALIPFLLEGVAGIRDLNQGDGIHPTVEGQKIVAENVWQVLTSVLQEAPQTLHEQEG
ncbi:arylesterase [Pontibacter sp. E15-1]|uniref:arylesterase n=1 Tax=Pontibacter sp. E15-1 TaxID=2919918 RepID=UPI001F500DC2|nr:arylesterase [Pontibacter sp. E15-1]MCJ8163585.1 arylesterase [Pontibacter sp. E15-1]